MCSHLDWRMGGSLWLLGVHWHDISAAVAELMCLEEVIVKVALRRERFATIFG